MMGCSIIIPTLNRTDSLVRCLNSIKKLDAVNGAYEVLVIDNGSTDTTRSVIEDSAYDWPFGIRYISEPEPGLLSGRHRGAFEATGEILIFIDDDVEVEPGWLQAIFDSFHRPDVSLVGGPSLPKYEVAPPAWINAFWTTTPYKGRACGWLSLLDLGNEPLEISPHLIWGLNFAIRRATLFALDGFHPDCIPSHLQYFQGDGESGLSIKAELRGLKAFYHPAAQVRHVIPRSRLTAEYFGQRAFYQGVCDSYTTIRRAHGLYGRVPARHGGFARALHRMKEAPIKYLKNWNKVWRLGNASVEKVELHAIERKLVNSKLGGYNFHQEAVRRNTALLDWVIRPNYWDYHLPEGKFLIPERSESGF